MLEDHFEMARREGLGGSTASGGTAGISGGGGGGSCDGLVGGRCGEGSAGGDSAPDSGAAEPDSGVVDPDSGAGVVLDPLCGTAGVRGPNDDCYASGSTEESWSDARESCQSRGANWDLAIIRDATENDFVRSITGFEAWIGATDDSNEGTWSWVRDDDPFFDVENAISGPPYTNWNVDEPNDADGSDCLRILTTGLWADWQCASVMGYVCQETTP